MARQAELFDKPPRPPTKRRAHMIDIGDGIALYECRQCGWQSDWTGFGTISEVRRGIPCPQCNEQDRR